MRVESIILLAGAFLAVACDDGPPTEPLVVGSSPVWTLPGVGHRSGDLVADGERVFLSDPGTVTAFDARTGRVSWQFEGGLQGFATPRFVIADDVVVVSWSGRLHGLGAREGSELWSKVVDPEAVLVSDDAGIVYVADAGELARIEPLTGAVTWIEPLEGSGHVALAAGPSGVCSRRSPIVTVACHDATSGALLWSVPQATIAPAGGIVVTGDRVVLEGDVEWIGYELGTGREVWRNDETLPSLTRARVGGNVISACEAICVAVGASDGVERWRRDLGWAFPPAGDDAFLFVVAPGEGTTGEGRAALWVLDPSTGVTVDLIEPGGDEWFFGAPVYSDGSVVVRATNDLRAYRFP